MYQNFTSIRDKAAFEYIKFKFIEKVEKTSEKFIYETLNEFSMFNEQTFRFDSLILYNLNRLDGAYLNLDLVRSNDFILFDGFNFSRTYSSKISLRKAKSWFGHGWIDNLDIRVERDELFDIIWVHSNGNVYRLEPGDQEGVYLMKLVRAELNQNLIRVELLNEGILIEYDLNRTCVNTFKLLNRNESAIVECNQGRIGQIETSSSRISLTYSAYLIKYVNRVDKNTGEKVSIVYQYDSNDRLVLVQKDNSIIEYGYNDFDSLSFVNLKEKRIIYDYNNDNLIRNIKVEKMNCTDKENRILYNREFSFQDNGPIEIIDLLNNNKSIRFMVGLGGNVYTINNSNKALKYKSNFQTLKSSTYLNDELKYSLSIDLNSGSVLKTYPVDDVEFKTNILFKNFTHQTSELYDFNKNKIVVSEKFAGSAQTIEIMLEDGSREAKTINKNAKSVHIETRDGKNEIEILFDEKFADKKLFYAYKSFTSGEVRACNFAYNEMGMLKDAWNNLDSSESISMIYNSDGNLIQTFYNENHSVYYDYDSDFDLIRTGNADIDFLYQYSSIEKNKKLSGLTYKNKRNQIATELLQIIYLPNGYEIKYLNEKRSHIYLYDTETSLLTNYTIVDLAQSQNSLSYLYFYDEKASKRLVKLFKGNGKYFIYFFK